MANHINNKKNIALCHFRVGETDGVSLEMDKWKTILERQGHTVHYLAGNLAQESGYVIPELQLTSRANRKFFKNGFIALTDYRSPKYFRETILRYATRIEKKLKYFIETHHIDHIIVNNIFSLSCCIPTAIAFARVIEKYKIPSVAHHHDFYWEREIYSRPTCTFIHEVLNHYYPLKSDYMNHVVINEIAKKELFERKGLTSTIIPNVFDFNMPPWVIDEYNEDFRTAIGVRPDDILVLQGTRVVRRKAIELAIDVVAKINEKLNNRRAVIVVTGLAVLDKQYVLDLFHKAHGCDVVIKFVNDIIGFKRQQQAHKKIYSLWDPYPHADFVSYPSILEGFGNQFLEALFAKKPLFLYEYPVYRTDIKYHHFDIISLGGKFKKDENGLIKISEKTIEKAADTALKIINDKEKEQEIVNKNYKLGKEFFSYNRLDQLLKELCFGYCPI